MFNVGDEVRVVSNGAQGVVGYAEEGYICVDLNSGVEMDFTDESQLQLVADYKAEKAAEVAVADKTRDLSGMFNAPYCPRKGDKRLAANVIKSLGVIMPDLLKTAERKIEGFAKMEAFDQVKSFSELVGTPMVVFMGAAEMGNSDMMRLVIQKTLVTNAIAGTSLLYDTMVASLQAELAEKS
ncbi:hypothetical protein LCGC14_1527950 [marine sediment metagenome]|uniref:Uncharacterized protein n=1 Tax=marine sediment metagenome TaxID=412755 RepID=A0A0F9IWQ7_9ZZZZ